jgi:putative NIF3 family GTP cyclohydrolase 1 type 2
LDKLYLAGTFRNPEVVKKIAGDQVTDCVDLFSIQEEADTIIILHALYADEQFSKSSVKGRIIIKCSDTDVLVLCVHYYPRMQITD